MPKKKNQERNANPRTAQTVVPTFDPEAPAIAHILPPRGKKPEPWPAWLLRTFVNQDLLKTDPIALRDELFINHYRSTSWWSVVDNLLYTIEREAKRVLKDDPPAFEDHLESSCFYELSEQHFYDIFSMGRFTYKQASAIAALRGIHVIRELTHADPGPSGQDYLCDPHAEHTYDSITASRIAMEMALVIVNAIRGEFLESHAPLIEHGVAFRQGPKYDRRDNLGREIERAFRAKGLKVSSRETWADFQRLGESGHKIIQEVTDDEIYWKGRKEPTSFRSFQNRFYRIRKRLKQHPSPTEVAFPPRQK
jgi:hypothetical protein